MHSENYLRGYEAALVEIYVALDSEDHPRACGPCRACSVIRDVISNIFLKIGAMLSPDDFGTLSRVIRKLNQ